MIIKDLQYNDFLKYKKTIKDFLTESYKVSFNILDEYSINIIENKIQLLEDYMKCEKAILIGALQKEDLVGFLWIYRHDYFGETRLHINHIIVDHNFKGKGIGTKLVDKAEKKAKDLGVRVIDLFVSEDNLPARDMYTNLGFITERRYLKKSI